MFNLTHILYMVISTVITVALLVIFYFFIKAENHKRLILKISAVLTVILHYSSLWVDYLATGSAEVASPMLFPIFPCNVLMWMLLICAFKKDFTTKFAKVLLEFTFYGGVFCGIVGIVFNENFDSNPTLADWDVFKGLLSHSTMVLGCLYVLVGKFIKIRVSNCISVLLGLLFFLVDGGIIIAIYKIFSLDPPNCMYLLENPFPDKPWLNTYTMGITGVILVFVITAIYEQLRLPKEQRWYSIIKTKIDENKQRRKQK